MIQFNQYLRRRISRCIIHNYYLYIIEALLKERDLRLDKFYADSTSTDLAFDRRADELRDAVRVIPKDRILIETDAPYLTPRNVPGLGRTNVPENIIYVARTLAQYMQIPEEELIRCAAENTRRVFKI